MNASPNEAWLPAIMGLLMCSVICHTLIKRFWPASMVGGVLASLLNVLWEMWRADFALRPVDILFWLPGMFVEGFLLATTVCCVVGVPFKVARRQREKTDTSFSDHGAGRT